MTTHRDEGSILPLLLGFIAIASGLILVCAAATGIGTTRKTLYSIADASALAAAQSFTLDSADLLPGESIDEAVAYATAVSVAASFESVDVELEDFTLDTAGTVTLTARTTWSTGMQVFGIVLDAPVSVTVSSRAVVR